MTRTDREADSASQSTASQPTASQPTTSPPTTSEPAPLEPLTSQPPTSEPPTSGPPTSQALLEPRDGVPPVVADPDALVVAAERIAAGVGPVALDAERASGYRYGNRAYLVQLRRRVSGTVLIDPIGLTDLGPLAQALRSTEWVLHAASQDLGCLAELGLRPMRLFDTELAGRLLGYPRVALGTLVEEILGYRLEKGHAAVDWSKRPLPASWLRYAALDVELLVELRDALAQQLVAAGKEQWAIEEFAALCELPPAVPREEPWRRTSGLHRVRKPRQLGVVRELWGIREQIAERRNLAPGRVLPDTAIVEAALALPTTVEELAALPAFSGRSAARAVETWFRAIQAGRGTRTPPPLARPHDGPPPPRSWPSRNPDAAARLSAGRRAVSDLAAELELPPENLLSPDSLRRLAWEPPVEVSTDTVAELLRGGAARPWQVQLTAPVLAAALAELPDSPAPIEPDQT